MTCMMEMFKNGSKKLYKMQEQIISINLRNIINCKKNIKKSKTLKKRVFNQEKK